MNGRDMDAVDVYAGTCRIEDGTLHVEHAPLRAVNPLVLLLGLVLIALTVYTALTGHQFGRPGSPTGWRIDLGFGVLILLATFFEAYRKDVLLDETIPASAITGVRIETESRGWYFKQTRELPVVVIEYSDGGRTETYPIRLSLHDDAYETELSGLRELFDSHGLRVRDARSDDEDGGGWLGWL